jgi:16S rRNA (guanine527-N7)-methyltransferase
VAGPRPAGRGVGWWDLLNDERVERWLRRLVATPGLTSIHDLAEARRVHVDDALAALPLLDRGPVVDVGSGGGSPGIPLAAARRDIEFHLLESSRKKCEFLNEVAAEFPNAEVVCARAEEHAAGAGRDFYATAISRALAPPPVAAEWCLPLVAPGGTALLFIGPTADANAVGQVAERLGAGAPEEVDGLLVLRKVAPTPEGFPRRPGIGRKRPLA